MVHQVERLHAELQAEALGEREIANDSQVEADESGGPDDVPAGISEADAGRDGKRGRVEPVLGGTLTGGQIAVGDAVRTRGGAGARRVGRERRRDRLSGLRREDAGELPVPDEMGDEAARLPEGQLIEAADDEAR